MNSPYRDATDKYPWLSNRKINDQEVRFMHTNFRSDSWYGGDINQNNSSYLNLIRRGDRVIDCGANEGFLAVLAALRAGHGGSVLALEPGKHNWEPLNINIALNNLQSRIHPQPWAVGDVTGKIDFNGEAVREGEKVECVRLDEFCWFGPDIIKIDVEGYELKVLRGAREIMTKHKPTIFLELHLSGDGGVDMRTYGDTPQQLCDLMKEYGYRVLDTERREITPETAPNGVVILTPDIPKFRPRTLIYTVAHGPEFFRMANLMVGSLREIGEYDGDLIVVTDRPGKISDAITIERKCETPVPHMEKAAWGRMPLIGYDRFLFLDADLVFLKPILPILEWDCELAMPVEHPAVAEGDKWFGNSPVGYNTGTILSRGSSFPALCDKWLDRMNKDRCWEIAGHDQPCMNNMIHDGEVSVKPFPREWFYFYSPDSEPLTKHTIIAHPKGDGRLQTVKALHGMRCLWP